MDKDGNETNFEIHTDKTTVGEALMEVGLLEGEESEYGLFVIWCSRLSHGVIPSLR